MTLHPRDWGEARGHYCPRCQRTTVWWRDPEDRDRIRCEVCRYRLTIRTAIRRAELSSEGDTSA